MVGLILILGAVGSLIGDGDPPEPGSYEWCENQDLSRASCDDLNTIVETFTPEVPTPTFADGSEMPSGMVAAGEVCNELYPFDDVAFTSCVLRNAQSVEPGTQSSRPESQGQSTTTIEPRSTTTTSSAAPTTTTSLPALTTTTVQFPTDPNEPAPPTPFPTFLQTGLGVVSIGDPAPLSIETLTEIHGSPTRDTGWEPSFSSFGTCPGEQARLIQWGSLEVIFVKTGQAMELFPYTIPAHPDGTLLSITEYLGSDPLWRHPTWYDVAVGDSVADLLNVYGNRTEVIHDTQFDSFYFAIDAGPGGDAQGRITGLTSGTEPDDQITSLHTGSWCGE